MPKWDSFDSFLQDAKQTANSQERRALVEELLAERRNWPWVEEDKATFVFTGMDASTVALNLDTIEADPPFAPFDKLEGTRFWYLTREFAPDDLLDYLLAVDDPMKPLANDPDIVDRISRYWRMDPLNPTQMSTPQMNVSVLRMNEARPFPDWSALPRVPRGKMDEHRLSSTQVGFRDRKLNVYLPPGYDSSGAPYPLLIFQDGQWATGPLQLAYIADAVIKHQQMRPVVIAMIQSGDQQVRNSEYINNDRYYTFLLLELLPFIQANYHIDSTNLGLGGVAVGAVAAAHAALKNPSVFTSLIMVSAPLGKGAFQDQLRQYASRFDQAEVLPKRIFQSVGRYETRSRFYRPALELRDILKARRNLAYQFVETGSGHGLVGFRSVLPEALAWAFPGAAYSG